MECGVQSLFGMKSELDEGFGTTILIYGQIMHFEVPNVFTMCFYS